MKLSSGAVARDLRPAVAAPESIVTLLLGDEGDVAAWRAALADLSVTCLAASTLDEAVALLSSHEIRVVVSRWETPLFDRVQAARRGVLLIHVGARVGQPVIEGIRQGFEIAHVSSEAELTRKLEDMLAEPRAAARLALGDLTITWPGANEPYRVLDFSTDGVAFHVDFATTPPLPGTLLDDVVVTARGRVALEGARLIVRNVAVLANERVYRVGCALRVTPARSDEPSAEISDRGVIAGILCRALSGQGLLVTAVGSALGSYCTSGEVDVGADELVLHEMSASPAVFDVVTCRFESGGSSYHFTTSVKSASPIVLRFPRVLEQTRQRAAARYRPSASHPLRVELDAPLLTAPIVRDVLDVGGSGFAFAMDAARDILPPGALVEVAFRVQHHELRCRGVVRSISRDGHGTRRCGVELRCLDEGDRIRLADLLMRTRFPSLDDASKLSFDETWGFFLRSKFIYPEKAAALMPLMPSIRRTHERLAAHPNRLAKSVICREGDSDVAGHLSILRAWSNAWLVQHLASLPGRLGGAQLSMLAAEFMEQNLDLDCFKAFYRPNNHWPDRVFGGFARKVRDTEFLDLRTWGYFKLDLDTTLPGDDGLEVIEAVGDDLSIVERYFIEREPSGLLIRSEDLTANQLTLRQVDQLYSPLGLTRRRIVLLALEHGRPVGFALAELSSPGLNLSELLSAFRLFVLPGHDPRRVQAALVRACLPLYKRAGRPFAIGLVPDDAIDSLTALGLPLAKRYTCWTCRRELLPRFFDHVNTLVRPAVIRRQQRLQRLEPM